MTHYQKLAIMIFRLFGALCMFLGALVGLAYPITQYLFYGLYWELYLRFASFYTFPFLIFGFVLFIASRPLGRWICFDFEA